MSLNLTKSPGHHNLRRETSPNIIQK
jgi:hypothetical protein